jgi:hypothetical protein
MGLGLCVEANRLLGELSKLVPLSEQRVAAVTTPLSGVGASDDERVLSVRATIVGVVGERVQIAAVNSNRLAASATTVPATATCTFTASSGTRATFSCTGAGVCSCA